MRWLIDKNVEIRTDATKTTYKKIKKYIHQTVRQVELNSGIQTVHYNGNIEGVLIRRCIILRVPLNGKYYKKVVRPDCMILYLQRKNIVLCNKRIQVIIIIIIVLKSTYQTVVQYILMMRDIEEQVQPIGTIGIQLIYFKER